MSKISTVSNRLTTHDVQARKGGTPLVSLTAYTAPMAALLAPHCDVLLVGDSLGMVVHGLPDTLSVTPEMMILHAQAVMRGVAQADLPDGQKAPLVVVDLPFGSYEASPQVAYDTAVQVLKETEADAVKLETSAVMAETVAFLTARGVPVMGHVGLLPQASRRDGGFRVKGKRQDQSQAVLANAKAIEDAGAFALVIEGVTESLATEITGALHIPTIGIGASAACDGQVLVVDDMLGMFAWTPKFVKPYGEIRQRITDAVAQYAADVRTRAFPSAQHCYQARADLTSPA